MKKLAIFKIIFLTLLLTLPLLSCAQNTNLTARVELNPNLKPNYSPDFGIQDSTDGGKTTTPGAEADYVSYVLQLIAGGLLYLAGPVAILAIAVSGLRYVVAHGDQTQIENAKKNLTWAIIGLIVIILSFAVVKAIIALLLHTS